MRRSRALSTGDLVTGTMNFATLNGVFAPVGISDEILVGIGTVLGSYSIVPEPTTAVLLGIGLVVLGTRRRRLATDGPKT